MLLAKRGLCTCARGCSRCKVCVLGITRSACPSGAAQGVKALLRMRCSCSMHDSSKARFEPERACPHPSQQLETAGNSWPAGWALFRAQGLQLLLSSWGRVLCAIRAACELFTWGLDWMGFEGRVQPKPLYDSILEPLQQPVIRVQKIAPCFSELRYGKKNRFCIVPQFPCRKNDKN